LRYWAVLFSFSDPAGLGPISCEMYFTSDTNDKSEDLPLTFEFINKRDIITTKIMIGINIFLKFILFAPKK
jgi:hypothetical protein